MYVRGYTVLCNKSEHSKYKAYVGNFLVSFTGKTARGREMQLTFKVTKCSYITVLRKYLGKKFMSRNRIREMTSYLNNALRTKRPESQSHET